MIIKGRSVNSVGYWAAHLTSAKNERVEIIEIRDLLSRDLLGAFKEMQDVAAGSNCAKFMYHANIDPDPRFPMTPAQWREAVDTLEKKLGLTDQPRAVVAHVKEGREHRHVMWSRVNGDTLRAVSDSHNYRKHEEVSRELERQFGHERVQGAHAEREGKERPARTPDRADIQQQERAGKSGRAAVEAVKQVKADLTALWGQTRTGQEFAAAVAERGYILAQGDRRDFVVVDRVGAVHSLARRIEGVRTAAVRERMADVDRAELPTLAAAKAHQVERRHGAEGAPIMREQQPEAAPAEPQPTPLRQEASAGQADKTAAGDIEAEAARQPARQADMLAKMERQAEARRAFVEEQAAAAAKAREEEKAGSRRKGTRGPTSPTRRTGTRGRWPTNIRLRIPMARSPARR